MFSNERIYSTIYPQYHELPHVMTQFSCSCFKAIPCGYQKDENILEKINKLIHFYCKVFVFTEDLSICFDEHNQKFEVSFLNWSAEYH